MKCNTYERKSIRIDILKKAAKVAIDRAALKDIFFDISHDLLADTLFVTFVQKLAAAKIGTEVIKYPENWKEALKERWFPEWMKKKYPVRYKKFDVRVCFPDYLRKIGLRQKYLPSNVYYFAYFESEHDEEK